MLVEKNKVSVKWEGWGFVFCRTASGTGAFLCDRGGSAVISWEDYMWPGVSTEQYCYPSGVQSGVTLWGEPGPLSTSIGPRWHKFSLTCRYDCQSAPSVRHENGAGNSNLSEPNHYEVYVKVDCSFLSLGIRSHVQTAATELSLSVHPHLLQVLVSNYLGLRFSEHRINY